MDAKSKIIVIVLLGIILIFSPWVLKNPLNPVNCSNITSTNGIDKCLEGTIVATGTLECKVPDVIKGTGIALNFDDGTALVFLDAYQNVTHDCTNYDAKRVEVVATYYQCKMQDQCGGIGLRDIKSVKLIG